MDKKTSVSTLILVLLILLTLVSLGASAYLYFTNNSLTAKENSDPAECVDEDPYKGWTLYSDDKNSLSILFYYPKDWTVEDNVDIDFIKKALPQANWNFQSNSDYKYLKISQKSDPSKWILVTRMGEINDSEFNFSDYVSKLVKEDTKIGYTSLPLHCEDISCPTWGFMMTSDEVLNCYFSPSNADENESTYFIMYSTSRWDNYLYSVSYSSAEPEDPDSGYSVVRLILDSIQYN